VAKPPRKKRGTDSTGPRLTRELKLASKKLSKAARVGEAKVTAVARDVSRATKRTIKKAVRRIETATEIRTTKHPTRPKSTKGRKR